MFQAAAFPYEVPADPMKTLVTTSEQFAQMMRQLWDNPNRIFDHETSGLSWWKKARSCGVGFGVFEGDRVRSWYVPIRHLTTEPQLDIARLDVPIRQLFADPGATWIGHHIKFDDHINRREGWYIGGKRYCTQMAGRLWNENDLLRLELRVQTDLGVPKEHAVYWQQRVMAEVHRLARARRINVTPYKDQYGYSEVSTSLLGYYGCHDIDWTGKLWQFYEGHGLSNFYSRIWPTEMALNEVITDMEEYGMPIDVGYLEQLRDRLTRVTATLSTHIRGQLGTKFFDPGLDADVRKLVYKWLGAERRKRTKSGEQWSVDREVLSENEWRHPVVTSVMKWRDANKILTTWTDSILNALDDNHVLHGSFKPDGTTSGRLSSSGPNLQNFIHDSNVRSLAETGMELGEGGFDPWSVRVAFIMRRGQVRLYFDYSQIELRVLTWYTREPNMVGAYLRGQDIHERTQDEIEALTGRRPPRRLAKIINFGLVYCMTARGLARQARVSESGAEFVLDAFFRQYPQSRMRRNRCMNIFGRTRTLSQLNSMVGWQRRRAKRMLFGGLIQGTAGELTKESLVRIHRFLKSSGSGAHLVGTVHDEISLDCPVAELTRVVPVVKHEMERYPEFDPIPILVDGEYSVENWANKQPLPLAA